MGHEGAVEYEITPGWDKEKDYKIIYELNPDLTNGEDSKTGFDEITPVIDTNIDPYLDGYHAGYHDGFQNGYHDGYIDGKEDAKKDLNFTSNPSERI